MSQLFRIRPFWQVILREFEVSPEDLARRAGMPANLFAADPVMAAADAMLTEGSFDWVAQTASAGRLQKLVAGG